MEKLGEIIKKARKRANKRLEDLGHDVGLSMSSMSCYENDRLKGGPDPDTLVRIADSLNDLTILTHHCQTCPVRNHILLKQFPELNNIRHDPAINANRLRKEMSEALGALDRLTERYSDKDFKSHPDYHKTFLREMEQVVDVKRGIEILEFERILSGAHSGNDTQKVYDRQQTKCEARGHHHPEKDAA